MATGLKWMLASQSVVLMAPPRREIWEMESLLQVRKTKRREEGFVVVCIHTPPRRCM